ncbi:MAG: nucleoside monophosphate kinase [bacterium]
MNNQKVILIFGPPVSGKTTTALRLSVPLKFQYLSIGELVRNEIIKNTDFGRKARKFIENKFVFPKNFLKKIIISNLPRKNNFVLDGYPKSIEELSVFKNIITEYKIIPIISLVFDIDRDTMVFRLKNRLFCPHCRMPKEIDYKEYTCLYCGKKLIKRIDDSLPLALKRYEHFYKNTNKVIAELQKDSVPTIKINGNSDLETVFQQAFKTCQSILLVKNIKQHAHG